MCEKRLPPFLHNGACYGIIMSTHKWGGTWANPDHSSRGTLTRSCSESLYKGRMVVPTSNNNKRGRCGEIDLIRTPISSIEGCYIPITRSGQSLLSIDSIRRPTSPPIPSIHDSSGVAATKARGFLKRRPNRKALVPATKWKNEKWPTGPTIITNPPTILIWGRWINSLFSDQHPRIF